MKLVKQGETQFFGNKRVLMIHLEFTSTCNRTCSYCIEDNGNPEKVKEPFSDEKDMINAIDKIFAATKEEDFIGFIIAGGEPTLQPAFPAVISKIQSRKNTSILLTTNFHKPAEYYEKLGVPLITSLHLEDNDPKEFLDKIKRLKHLIAHVRIMAHPDKMDLVKQTYQDFIEASKNHNISFAVERIYPYRNYIPNYSQEELNSLETMKPVDCSYPESLNENMGLLRNAFYRFSWWYEKDDQIIEKNQGTANFSSFYCERNLLVVHSNGNIEMSWCHNPNINIFQTEKLPKNTFGTVLCDKNNCPMGFVSLLPKFNSNKYAPLYLRK